jgi:heme A synthase
MSAPQTNMGRQEKRHRGPLLGIAAALILALALVLGLGGWTAPEDTATTTRQNGCPPLRIRSGR